MWKVSSLSLHVQTVAKRIIATEKPYWHGDNPMQLKVVISAACVLAALGAWGAAPALPDQEKVAAADRTQRPWTTNTQAMDVEKSKVQEIFAGLQKYTITQGGTMDGRNCRSPMGCGMSREGACYQTWESNRSLRMAK